MYGQRANFGLSSIKGRQGSKVITSLLLSICSLFACSVHAQTTSPQFIVSQNPQTVNSVGEPVGWTHDPQFIGLNNYLLNVESSTLWDPEDVADTLIDRVHARLYVASPASLSEEENPVGFWGRWRSLPIREFFTVAVFLGKRFFPSPC